MRWIRPLLLVVVGTLVILLGLLMALDALATTIRVGGVDDAPGCATDFARGCSTERAAVLDHKGAARGSWFTREQRWLAQVPDGAPGLQGRELLDVTVPRQGGREELVEGAEVTVIYHGRSPAWIRLPSGRVLETEDHPRRKAPTLAWLAVASLAGGVFALRNGIRAGRLGHGWLRRVRARPSGGLDAILLLAGAAGLIAHQIAGGTAWPGFVVGLLTGGVGIVLWARARRRRAVAT